MDETRAGQGFLGEFAGESSQTPWQPDQEFRRAQVGRDLQNNFWGQLPGLGGDFATQVCRDVQNNDFWVQPLEFGGDCAAQVGGDVQNNFCGQPQEVLSAPQVRGDVQDNFWGQKLDDAFIDIENLGRFLETEFTHQFRALSSH
ncbi:hypothetical protein SELMODRAFT_407747 [Selaginella moellendorffii]|uniref:Uncharacterized protein n=1 Tax=Selaginella moellendorffii TaxID=88036 RepID=D8R6M3_SELML|nr:hypothetical protein SELMODRAFT_407747 [Selaginella moellendorffii]